MIEAVENHMPEVIVIDEIGTELEAMAASTIAQRGVQLVGTAHGVTIESIIKNPCLQMLVGGIEVHFLPLLLFTQCICMLLQITPSVPNYKTFWLF
jgi:stage III sporulation protein SpoIIIAA